MAKVATVYRQMPGYDPVVCGCIHLPAITKEIVIDTTSYFTLRMEEISNRFNERYNFKNVKWWFVVTEYTPPTGQTLLKKLSKKTFR